jgi:cytochrome c
MIIRVGMIFSLICFIACNISKKATNSSSVTAGKSDSLVGLGIVKQSDCITCHSINKKLLGPAFTEIANKYSMSIHDIDKLYKKIITGGSGVWGELPMTPHRNLSVENAKAIVKYILLLKN